MARHCLGSCRSEAGARFEFLGGARAPALSVILYVCTIVPTFAHSPVIDSPPSNLALHTSTRIWAHAELVGRGVQAWIFKGPDGERIQASDVVRWGTWRGVRSQSAVWLSDGSWICGEVGLEAGVVSLRNDWLNCPKIPVSAIRGMVLRPPGTLAEWIKLQRDFELRRSARDDTVWLNSRGTIKGIFRWPDQEVGRLQLETGKQNVEFSLEDIDAINVSPALMGDIPIKSSGTRLGLRDGSLLNVNAIRKAASGTLELALHGGLQLASHDDSAEFTRSITFIQHIDATRYRYLSDLTPASFKHLPDSSLQWTLGKNVDLHRRPLLVDGGIVRKGLAMHSSSQVAFFSDGAPGRLLAEVRFAPTLPGSDSMLGNVICQVLLARGGKLSQAAEFALARDDRELPSSALVDVDVTDAKLIVLVTGSGDLGQFGDHVLWLDARIAGETVP